jgi:hypothetical protein
MAVAGLRLRRRWGRVLLDVSDGDAAAAERFGVKRPWAASMTGLMTRYAAIVVGIVVVVGGLLALVFRGPGDVGAIALSGAIALAVQLAAFALGRLAGPNNLMARMGTGAILRLFTLVVYAILAAKVLMLPLVAALVSLAAFYFLTTLVEPLLIRS